MYDLYIMFEPTYTFIKVSEEQKKRFIPPNEKLNSNLLTQNNIVTNFTYRDYLIANGKKITQKNSELYKDA